jgi:spore coat protein U-like protein
MSDALRSVLRLGAWLVPSLILSLLGATSANAACNNLAFGAIQSSVTYIGSGSGYNPFDPTDRKQSVSFSVTKLNGACAYFITASPGNTNNFNARQLSGPARLSYNLYPSANSAVVLGDLPGATASQTIVGSMTGGVSTANQTYQFDIPVQQVVAAGLYSDTVQFKLYQGILNNNTLAQMVNVTHSAYVPSVAELSLVPTGGAFDVASVSRALNFGVLSQGEILSTDLLVRGNNGFDVAMQSLNAGVMKLNPALDTSTVPYRLTVSGALANLTGAGTTVASINGATSLSGNRFPIQVTIGAIDPGAAAGNYVDSVTVTVTSH